MKSSIAAISPLLKVMEALFNREARPLPFITVCDNKLLQVSTDAIQLLSQFKNKVGIVAFTGSEGCGKSFLANQCCSGQFSLAHMRGYGTKGIWLWSHPISSGDLDLLVLDCQGINSEEYSPEVAQKLLQLTLLISSQIVLSTKGHISDNTLQDLKLLAT